MLMNYTYNYLPECIYFLYAKMNIGCPVPYYVRHIYIQGTASISQYLIKKTKLCLHGKRHILCYLRQIKKNYPHSPAVKLTVRLIFQKCTSFTFL